MIAGGVAGFLLTICGANPAFAQNATAYVLSNNSLIPIQTASPNAPQAAIPIVGLNPGDALVGIDFRPQNGHLYGLGRNIGAGTVQLYHISHRTGVAMAVGTTGTYVHGSGTPFATSFGFDFNPATDRIRVVASGSLNFRINPNTGAFVDGDLGGAAGSVVGLNTDGDITGAAANVEAAAYTNNQPNATVTTLYTLSGIPNALYIQNPPNVGTQTNAIVVTQGGKSARLHDGERVRHPAERQRGGEQCRRRHR